MPGPSSSFFDATSEYAVFQANYEGETDRVVAILATSYPEDGLEKYLLHRLVPHKRAMKRFEGYGPLGTLSAKIDLAYAVGLIPEDITENLHRITKIRKRIRKCDNPREVQMSKMKSKAKSMSSASRPDESAKSSLKADTKAAQPGASEAKPIRVRKGEQVVLLSGGNPQIAKGYGNAPVQAYIAAMPGWKSDVGRRLDAVIVRTVPGVQKAVKWNTPLYGIEGQGWFLSYHCFTKYVKVAFFRGTSLHPIPPGESKQKDVRYLDIRENDRLNEVQFADWVEQASRLPGERM